MPLTASRSDRYHVLKIVLAFAAIYTIWGTTYLAIRIAVETIPPFFMTSARMLIAGIITFAFLRARPVDRGNHQPDLRPVCWIYL